MMNDFALYQKDEGVFNNRFVTKLLRNYRCGTRDGYRSLFTEIMCLILIDLILFILFRSHPAILKVPNELFYDEELQCCADEMLRNSYCRWEYLKKEVMLLLLANTNTVQCICKLIKHSK